MKRHAIYTLLVLLLFLSPLVMPRNGIDYTIVSVSIFVVLCYTFKVQSLIKIILPVFIFSFILPALIQIAITKSIPLPWDETITKFIGYQTVGTLLSYIIPIAIAFTLYFILNRILFATKNN